MFFKICIELAEIAASENSANKLESRLRKIFVARRLKKELARQADLLGFVSD